VRRAGPARVRATRRRTRNRDSPGKRPPVVRATPGASIEISLRLPRRNVEALQLEIRRLARLHSITIEDIRVERPGEGD
jgi:hypothetical protein